LLPVEKRPPCRRRGGNGKAGTAKENPVCVLAGSSKQEGRSEEPAVSRSESSVGLSPADGNEMGHKLPTSIITVLLAHVVI
jgi:hypothetical protein